LTKIKEGSVIGVILIIMPEAGGIPALQKRGASLLAAVIYQSGFPVDEFMAAIAATLRGDNLRLGGAIQQNASRQDTGQLAACSSAMTLIDLSTGERFGISQDLGSQSQDCRLDSCGLAELGGVLDVSVDDSLDLVILNKFGKAEADGGGLRSVIARSIDVGVPALTAVRSIYREDWQRFHGGVATDLVPQSEVTLAWCRRAVGRRGMAQLV
jgi:hypothetical protein